MTTDPWPVRRLQPHLRSRIVFAEPCAGNGDLIKSMKWFGHRCVYAGDIKPGNKTVEKRDAMTLDKRWGRHTDAEMFVTNLPWLREVLHPLIDRLSSLLPLWTLLDADYAHTKQAVPYLNRCAQIVSVGRVKWIENSDNGGVDNVAWYLFDARHTGGPHFTGLV